MNHPLVSLADRFRFNNKLYGMLADGLDDADWSSRPEGGGNSAQWILGHLAAARRSLRRRLGAKLASEPWEAGYARGADGGAAEGAPSPDALASDFLTSCEPLASLLEAVDVVTAATEWQAGFPDGSTTLEGGCHFLYFHETYHLGQFGYLRASRGKGGIT